MCRLGTTGEVSQVYVLPEGKVYCPQRKELLSGASNDGLVIDEFPARSLHPFSDL